MHDGNDGWLGSPGWQFVLVFAGFAAIGAFLMAAEHRVHALGLLPIVLLVLALCLLMHFFMHRRYDGH